MGYDLTSFIDKTDEELQCPICRLVLENPVQTQCEHFYCYKCILNWLTVKPVCPMDGQPLAKDVLQPPSRLLRNLLNKLAIRCRYYHAGCMHVTRLDNLDHHCATCPFNPDAEVVCNKGCNLNMTRREYNKFDCLNHYANRVIWQQGEILRLAKEVQLERLNKENQIGELKAKISKMKVENMQLKNRITELKNENDAQKAIFIERLNHKFNVMQKASSKRRSSKVQAAP